MTWRYIAERVRTGVVLDVDVDLVPDGPPQRELSGPGSFTFSVPLQEDPTVAEDGQPVIDDWSTAMYAELNGRIYWGGLVTDTRPSGDRLAVTCAGFAGYPSGQPYLSTTAFPAPTVDVFDVVRVLWAHLQGFPNSGLNLVVDTHDSGVKVGTTAQPYALVWWDATDCGGEIDNLARATPFDYTEEHTWNAARNGIDHRLHLAYPRIGGRREDLRFAAGENVAVLPAPDKLSDDYANAVWGIGKGEGSLSERVGASFDDKLRLRRVTVLTDKGLTSAQLQPIVLREVARRRAEWQVGSLVVMDHPNAPLGSWQLGDDIPVTLDQPFMPRTTLWHRVVADQMDPDKGIATLTLVRTDAYTL